MLMLIRDGKGSDDASVSGFSEFLKDRKIDLEAQVLQSVEAANSLMAKLRVEHEPFRVITHKMCPWEEKSAAVQLSNKICKSKRKNNGGKERGRALRRCLQRWEHEGFDEADREADEWRAREIAKDIAKRKMEDMKKIASLKAKEERKRLESELETVLIVEKLQELRSIRIEKMKKQGFDMDIFSQKRMINFLKEYELQLRRRSIKQSWQLTWMLLGMPLQLLSNRGKQPRISDLTLLIKAVLKARVRKVKARQFQALMKATLLQSLTRNLENKFYRERVTVELMMLWQTMEFYHYYHGSNTDMGTLIEVRRTWDAYIRPGGSRIPGHWVQPPPPADDIWASYLLQPK
ncbi:putative programmed cell death protein [Rosa chinensis]|uniref:Putative programmed cell death protein n=1 Tax=Rosa chinensis TaxID=74649 RepID=A0A2P6SI23_ROSCH|nr:putative programmed cell death protein [Rosa chinensis]